MNNATKIINIVTVGSQFVDEFGVTRIGVLKQYSEVINTIGNKHESQHYFAEHNAAEIPAGILNISFDDYVAGRIPVSPCFGEVKKQNPVKNTATTIAITGKDKALLTINAYSDSEIKRVVDAAFAKAGIEPTTAPNGQPSRNGWWEWSADMQSVVIHQFTPVN